MRRIFGVPWYLQLLVALAFVLSLLLRMLDKWWDNPVPAVHVAAGVTYVKAATSDYATFGGDAVIWIPIVIQILSFLAQLFKAKNDARDKGSTTPPAEPK